MHESAVVADFADASAIGKRIPVSRGLNWKHHQERDEGRSCFNDRLPRVAEAEQGARDRPNDRRGDDKH